MKLKSIGFKIIQFGLIPFCMFLVICVHFYHVEQGLSPWKGGGFGMYSTYYPEQSQMYIDDVNIMQLIKKDNDKKRLLRNYIFYPKKSNLDPLIQSLKLKNDTLHLEVWQPKVNAKNATYSRTLQHEYIYIQPRDRK